MGSMSMKSARNRVSEAIRQRLRAYGVSEETANREIFWEAINELEKIAVDEVELNRVARVLAVCPEKIEGLQEGLRE